MQGPVSDADPLNCFLWGLFYFLHHLWPFGVDGNFDCRSTFFGFCVLALESQVVLETGAAIVVIARKHTVSSAGPVLCYRLNIPFCAYYRVRAGDGSVLKGQESSETRNIGKKYYDVSARCNNRRKANTITSTQHGRGYARVPLNRAHHDRAYDINSF